MAPQRPAPTSAWTTVTRWNSSSCALPTPATAPQTLITPKMPKITKNGENKRRIGEKRANWRHWRMPRKRDVGAGRRKTLVYKAHIVATLIFFGVFFCFSGSIFIFPFPPSFLGKKTFLGGTVPPTRRCRVNCHRAPPRPSLGFLGAKRTNKPPQD